MGLASGARKNASRLFMTDRLRAFPRLPKRGTFPLRSWCLLHTSLSPIFQKLAKERSMRSSLRLKFDVSDFMIAFAVCACVDVYIRPSISLHGTLSFLTPPRHWWIKQQQRSNMWALAFGASMAQHDYEWLDLLRASSKISIKTSRSAYMLSFLFSFLHINQPPRMKTARREIHEWIPSCSIERPDRSAYDWRNSPVLFNLYKSIYLHSMKKFHFLHMFHTLKTKGQIQLFHVWT